MAQAKKNVLYISYDGMTDPLGQSQVLPYLTHLGAYDYQFTILSFEKPERFEDGKKIIQDICDKNSITWVPLPYTKSPPILSTFKDVRAMFKKAEVLQQQKNFQIVHCRSYIASMAGLMLQQKYNVKYLFDMRGLWANEKVDAGAWNLKNPLFNTVYKYFKKKEKSYFEKADYTVSLTHAGKKEIQSWDHIVGNPVPISVIPCCVDMEHFNPGKLSADQTDALRKELAINIDDFILSYLGSIGTWYMLNEMLDFYEVLLNKIPAAKFLFITGDEHTLIRSKWEARSLPASALIIRKGARSEVPALVSLCDYSIFFIRPTYSKISSSPTKQGELMAMGIPVICNDGVGDTAEIVNDSKAGIVVSGFNTAAYEEVVNKLQFYNFDADQMRIEAEKIFSLSQGVASYKKIYEQIAG